MIIALSGPSGIGKGFVKDSLREIYPSIEEIVWYTTRELRPNELAPNSNRQHISEETLAKMSEDGELALIQGMFGHRYAVKKQDLVNETGVFLTEIHPYVIKEAKEINPNIISIGLVTDDFDLLKERLVYRRKTESIDEIDKRIQSAKAEVGAIRNNLDYYNEIIEIARDNEHLIANIAQKMFAEYKKEGDLYAEDSSRQS